MTVTMPLHGKSTASLNIPRNEDTAAYLTNDNTTGTYTIHSTNDLSIRSTFTRHNICTNCKCFSKWLVGFIRVTITKRKVSKLQAYPSSEKTYSIEVKSENTLDAVFTSNTLAEEIPCMVKLDGILRLRWLRAEKSMFKDEYD